MTKQQELKIRKLRNDGWGYKKIAKALGINRDTVRNYCRLNDLGGYRQKKIPPAPSEGYSICKMCGSEFEPSAVGRKKLFCSEKCRREWCVLNPNPYKHKCKYCGKEYESIVKRQRFCSHNCYIRDRFWRKEDLEKISNDLKIGKEPDFVPGWIKKFLNLN